MSAPGTGPVQPIGRTAMRRGDRAVEDDGWIRGLLRDSAVGVFATAAGSQPFVNSNLFVYVEHRHAIYFHTAGEGHTRSVIEANPAVCFTAFELGRLLPAATALAFSCEYASATVFGRGEIVDDPGEAREALQALLDKYAPHLRPARDYHAVTDEELGRTAVYRVSVDEWVGKRKSVAADFNGAFPYRPATAGPRDLPQAAAFLLDTLVADRRAAGQRFVEFLRTPSMHLEVFELPAGGVDRQLPHQDDEVYYAAAGRATLQIEDRRYPVEPGGIFYVPAGVPHRFVDITEDLTVLVVFAAAVPAPNGP